MAIPTTRRSSVSSASAGLADWLILVEPDGAFLTPQLLKIVFPHGFESLDRAQRLDLQTRVDELGDNPARRAAFRYWFLREFLEWDEQLADGQRIPATLSIPVAEHGAMLRPHLILRDLDDPNRVRVGVFVWPSNTALDRRPPDLDSEDAWSASPTQRAEKWCRETNVPLAMVTDDHTWTVVWAPRAAATATCRFRISDVVDERVLQDGLVSLLSARRFFAVSDDPEIGETLERLFERAADAEVEIAEGLGKQVRRSVELVVAAISREHVGSGQRLLASVSDEEVYEAAVTVLMRFLFLLYAEERRLLPAEDSFWAKSYSILTLREQLREVARDGIDTLDRRSVAWHRLLGTFRAVHGGVSHDRLRLPAYGGALFDPDRFPFLEGRHESGDGQPVAIDDRTILAVLNALLTVEVGTGNRKTAQRLSYKALDVEQIGHCYEGLLDHGCAPVDELSVGLVGPEADEPELTIGELEQHLAAGSDALCEWLSAKERCKKTPTSLRKLLMRDLDGTEMARLRAACAYDDVAFERVKPFWGLLRRDLRDLPVVFMPGAKYVTQTSTRRNTGTQYTTRALAEEVVRHALEPLVYSPGPADGAPPEEWRIRTPAEILALRVCDPAVGSGAILTAACRYLADRLIEGVEEHGPGDDVFAPQVQNLLVAATDDQGALARREVVDHCLYGVDRNPIAAEMAKLSLWLTTMARERPFTFLDHAIQLGDSLLGVTSLDQLRWLHVDPERRQGQPGFETLAIEGYIDDAVEMAERLQSMSVLTLRDASAKQRLSDELREKLATLEVAADAVVGAALSTSVKKSTATFEGRLSGELSRLRVALGESVTDLEREAALAALAGIASRWLRTDLPDRPLTPWARHCMHWPIRFPEVFLSDGRNGFDAIVANPPFLGGKSISTTMGHAYREFLVHRIAAGVTGGADLCAYFILRMCSLASTVGTLATNSISQADTREVGLDQLVDSGWTFYRAVKTVSWPGPAGVEISKLWMRYPTWSGTVVLDGQEVMGISSLLDIPSRVEGLPAVLKSSQGVAFQGCILAATEQFTLDVTEASELLRFAPREADVIRPYLNGADLNEHPRHRASRWVIDFADWPEGKAKGYPASWAVVEQRVKPAVLNKQGYPGWADRWWQFWNPRTNLRAAQEGLERVVAVARVSVHVTPAFVDSNQVLSDAVVVFGVDDYGHFGVLSSSIHWWWAHRWCSTMRSAGLRYSPTDAVETFPFPSDRSGSDWELVSRAAEELHTYRSELMLDTHLGLTRTYNRFHSASERESDIVQLRELHVSLDRAVCDAYGWGDVKLDHRHWQTAHGARFTVAPHAKSEILDLLLELNHRRFAEEVAARLHEGTGRRNQRNRRSTPMTPAQASLL